MSLEQNGGSVNLTFNEAVITSSSETYLKIKQTVVCVIINYSHVNDA